jgi:hypothetical protein
MKKEQFIYRSGILAVLLVLNSCLFIQAQTPGWASMTGFRNAETSVQQRIVANARAAVNLSSGPSFVLASNGSVVWYTDAYDGDGARMRAAVNRYVRWLNAPGATTPEQITAQMVNDFAYSNYDQIRKNELVNWIKSCTTRTTPVISTDQAVLNLLKIRKQCLEWCNAVSLASSGATRNYSATAITDPAKYRPGMALYRTDRSHAAIIIDIEWDSTGRPIRFKLAEANYSPNNWVNPLGTRPWERRVQVGRQVTITGCKVVSFE